jgi:hypothetical protein
MEVGLINSFPLFTNKIIFTVLENLTVTKNNTKNWVNLLNLLSFS